MGGRRPIPRNIPVQVGGGSEQPDVVEDVPDYCGELNWMAFKGSLPPQTNL